MARYIDADALLDKRWDVPFETKNAHYVQVVDVADIEEAPTADVVEVVRCKDCTEWIEHDQECYCWHGFKENDFCSHGIRKHNKTCDTCRCNKVCDHNNFGFEDCGNYIPEEE